MIDQERERAEAREAGLRAKSSLQSALKALDSARGWGVVDILGGGLLPTLIKRSKMNRASEYLEAAKADLLRFSRELGDIAAFAGMNVSDLGFWGFADWFFDGMLSDWMVQGRINDARHQVQMAIARVDSILYDLDHGRPTV